MKILFVSEFFQPYAVGAANISTYLIAKKLSETNDVYVMTQEFAKKPWEYDGLTVYPLLPRYSPTKSVADIFRTEMSSFFKFQHFFGFYRTINNFCKLNKIDVINVQTDNLVLMIALLLQNRPVVLDIRDYYLTCPFMLKTLKCDSHHLFCLPSYRTKRSNPLTSFLTTIFFRLQSLNYFLVKNLILKPLLSIKHEKCIFVPNSNYVKEVLMEEFKNINIKAQVIHNPINADSYDPEKDIAKKKNILYASSLETSKGIWDCINAFENIKEDAVLEIAGDGPETDLVQQYIKNKGIKNIVMLGNLEYKKIPEVYRRAYITVQPSVWPEPFGRYILESFASGTPLITTPTGGTQEAIIDRETGLLVPPNDPQELTRAISELLSNKELYNNIRQNIVKEGKKYHADLIAQERMKVYKSFITK